MQFDDAIPRTGKRSLRITPGPNGSVTGIHYFAGYNGTEGTEPMTADGGVRGARTYAIRLDRNPTVITPPLPANLIRTPFSSQQSSHIGSPITVFHPKN